MPRTTKIMSSADLEATETITDLQVELQTSNALVKEIKSENDDLRRQLESANAFLKANLQRHADWKVAWKIERDLLSMREKKLENAEVKWKAKLEDLRKESDELERKNVWSRNGAKVHGGVELDRFKEIVAEHDSKTEVLTNEVS